MIRSFLFGHPPLYEGLRETPVKLICAPISLRKLLLLGRVSCARHCPCHCVIPSAAAVEVTRGRGSLASGLLGLAGLVHHHHAGLHPGERVHAALAGGVQAGGLQLQLVIAGHAHKRAPAEGPLEASTESVHSKETGAVREADYLISQEEARGCKKRY